MCSLALSMCARAPPAPARAQVLADYAAIAARIAANAAWPRPAVIEGVSTRVAASMALHAGSVAAQRSACETLESAWERVRGAASASHACYTSKGAYFCPMHDAHTSLKMCLCLICSTAVRM